MLTEAVNAGTGRAAGLKGAVVAGKTGTAENESGKDHSWFAGYASREGDEPRIAVCVIFERTGGGAKAAEAAGKMFGAYLEE
jgi:peptidoglycan glycosyltransferase